MKLNQLILRIFSLSMTLLVVSSCHNRTQPDNDEVGETSLKYAKMYTMTEHDGYTEVSIVDAADSSRVKDRFILLPEGVKAPAPSPKTTVIPVPIKSAVVYTTVHGAAIDELGSSDIIKGVVDASYFKTPSIVDGLRKGNIADVGLSSSPSSEKIIELAPGVIILNSYEGMRLAGVDKLGIPVIRMAENLEQSPLGRAEWIKLLGALTGKKHMADSIFNAVEKQYNTLSQQARNSSYRPKVLTENMYEGVWYIPGGKSYQSRIIADAGGLFPWSDNNDTGSLSLSFEQVLDRAADADVWLLKLFQPELSYADLIAMDSRYANFKAAKERNVFFADTQNGLLFEQSPFHPDRLLHDYIGIFNGKTDSLYYFKKMKP